MRRVILFILCLQLFSSVIFAQEDVAIAALLGVSDVEEVGSYEYERLSHYLEYPLAINCVSAEKLMESGLFTRYQAVSLSDYRSRHGDILSFVELSAIDGFSEEYAVRLMPFISLTGGKLHAERHDGKIRNELALRSACKMDVKTKDDPFYGYALKYALEAGDRLSADFAISHSYSARTAIPDHITGSLIVRYERFGGKIVFGDFNARFGQGLALWSGSNFGGAGTTSTLAERPSGISRCRSFSGSTAFTGTAADISLGKFRLSAFVACPGLKNGKYELMPAANVSFFGRFGQVSATHYACFSGIFTQEDVRIPDMKTSLDFSACVRGKDIFGEAVFDWVSCSVASIMGLTFPCGENLRCAAMLRYYPSEYAPAYSAARAGTTKCSNEYAVLLCGEFRAGEWMQINGKDAFGSSCRRYSGNFSLDCACFPDLKGKEPEGYSTQYKIHAEWNLILSDSFIWKLRVSERIRSWGARFRTGVRTDISWFRKRLGVNMRFDLLKCVGTGILGYAEGCYKAGRIAVYLRHGLFRIDYWEDRIYVYERDAPGTFNVPAYYGRGYWDALTFSWKFADWGKVYLRASYISYPFMAVEKKKPGRAELKVQCIFSL